MEAVIGTPFNDYIIGNLLNNLINALAGDDTVVGNLTATDRELVGGLGDDTLIKKREGGWMSSVSPSRTWAKLDGGDGNDRIYADPADLSALPSRVLTGGRVYGRHLATFYSPAACLLSGSRFFLVDDFFAGAAPVVLKQILGATTTTHHNGFVMAYGARRVLRWAAEGTTPAQGGNGNNTLDGGDGNGHVDPRPRRRCFSAAMASTQQRIQTQAKGMRRWCAVGSVEKGGKGAGASGSSWSGASGGWPAAPHFQELCNRLHFFFTNCCTPVQSVVRVA